MILNNLKLIATVSLDFYTNNIKTINVKQCDTNSRFIHVSFTEYGKKFALNKSSMSAIVRYKKPDGKYGLNDCEILEDGTIIIELTEQMTVVCGKTQLDVMVLGVSGVKTDSFADTNSFEELGVSILSSMPLSLNVIAMPIQGAELESGYDFTALDSSLAATKAAEADLITKHAEWEEKEDVRQENENLRIEAEKAREKNVQDTIDACNKKIDDEIIKCENATNQAVLSATEATTAATNASERANAAANEADIAKINANTEAQNCQNVYKTVSENAKRVIDECETASNRANIAAQECEDIVSGVGVVMQTEKGKADGVATLDETGRVPLKQLPKIESYDVGGEELGLVKNGGNVRINSDGTMTAPSSDGVISYKSEGEYSFTTNHSSVATGTYASVSGTSNSASGYSSEAQGKETIAIGDNSHSEGYKTEATGDVSHSEGGDTIAIGGRSHAEGTFTKAIGDVSHSEGENSRAYGYASHTEGCNTITTEKAIYGHAEGCLTKVDAIHAHSEGYQTEVYGDVTHSEGCNTKAIGAYSHVEGYGCSTGLIQNGQPTALGRCSHAEGRGCVSYGNDAHVQGRYNKYETIIGTYAHIIGNGSGSSTDLRSNAHTLDWQGNAWYQGSVTSNGADYAEFFEWLDGNTYNEDRIGLLVTLDGDKIRLANSDDEILGVISGTVAVLGDNYECEWNGKYLTDDFGRTIYQEIEDYIEMPETIEVKHEDGTKEYKTEMVKKFIGMIKVPTLNPDYDRTKEYTNRANRPEWSAVGMLGKLYVRDDGTATVNGYINVGKNGIATASTEKTNMRVLSRVNENVVRVLLK